MIHWCLRSIDRSTALAVHLGFNETAVHVPTVTPLPRHVVWYRPYASLSEVPAQTAVRLLSIWGWRVPQRPTMSAGLGWML